MVDFIKRHINVTIDSLNEITKQQIINRFNLKFEKDLNDYLKENAITLQNNPTMFDLGYIASNFGRYANNGEYLKRTKKEIFQFLFYANQFGLASVKRDYFEKASFTIGKKELECVGRNKSLLEPCNAEELQLNLLTFIPLSLIMRDKNAQDFYSKLDLGYSKSPYYRVGSNFLFSKLLHLLCQEDSSVTKSHLSFLISYEENEYRKRKTDGGGYGQREFKENSFNEYSSGYPALQFEGEQIAYLKLPFLEVLKNIIENNEKGFNESLLTALEKHKTYYGTFLIEREEINDRPEGWVSLWLTCACAIAHDKGMKREVTSDYIPEWLVKGEFEGLELVVE